MTWVEVNQAAFRTPPQAPEVSISLAPMRGTTYLWMTITTPMMDQLAWNLGQKLCLWVGQDKLAGWLKIAPSANGRAIKRLGRAPQTRTCAMLPPDEWRNLVCAKTACETWRIQGSALLIEIPWDFSETETGTGPAGHEVYS